MKLHLFHSLKDPAVFGFTEDHLGENLPPAYAPWEHSGEGGVIQVQACQMTLWGRPTPVADAIQRTGYYLGRLQTPLQVAPILH